MNKKFTQIIGAILIVFILMINSNANAAVGDTTIVTAQNAVHMSSHGNYSSWAVFPDGSKKYGKLILKYRIGCPNQACSSWDYTTQVFAEVPTGALDSTVVQYPDFKVDGVKIDTFKYNVIIVAAFIFCEESPDVKQYT